MKTKKELIEDYKKMNPVMGVFMISNNKNNKILIDNSIDIHSKWNRHRMELRFGKHKNKSLQNDWNLYGEESFIFDILTELKESDKDKDKVNFRKELKLLQNMIEDEKIPAGTEIYR